MLLIRRLSQTTLHDNIFLFTAFNRSSFFAVFLYFSQIFIQRTHHLQVRARAQMLSVENHNGQPIHRIYDCIKQSKSPALSHDSAKVTRTNSMYVAHFVHHIRVAQILEYFRHTYELSEHTVIRCAVANRCIAILGISSYPKEISKICKGEI